MPDKICTSRLVQSGIVIQSIAMVQSDVV